MFRLKPNSMSFFEGGFSFPPEGDYARPVRTIIARKFLKYIGSISLTVHNYSRISVAAMYVLFWIEFNLYDA